MQIISSPFLIYSRAPTRQQRLGIALAMNSEAIFVEFRKGRQVSQRAFDQACTPPIRVSDSANTFSISKPWAI